MKKTVVVVEAACVAPRVDWPELACVLRSYLRHRLLQQAAEEPPQPGQPLSLDSAPALIRNTVVSLRICDMTPCDALLAGDAQGGAAPTDTLQIEPLLYTMRGTSAIGDAAELQSVANEEEGHLQQFACEDGVNEAGDAALPACVVTPLPHATLDGLWESLFYGDTIDDSVALKRELVEYMSTALYFSLARVSVHHVAWNRLLLFYGPPGTGKTSLGKALAHKLAIRTGGLFGSAVLVEINAHSLFSRWFSESGKQVMQLFRHIHSLAADTTHLVCVLIDEVESLAAARRAAMRGNEPSDSIRVVNALLTQLDRLQSLRNVITIATSNLTDAIDDAFLDRADKRVLIGPPGLQARQAILHASVTELLERGLLRIQATPATDKDDENDNAQYNETSTYEAASSGPVPAGSIGLQVEEVFAELDEIARLSAGMNGRQLKKLPFLAYAALLSAHPAEPLLSFASTAAACDAAGVPVSFTLSEFLHHLHRLVVREQEAKST